MINFLSRIIGMDLWKILFAILIALISFLPGTIFNLKNINKVYKWILYLLIVVLIFFLIATFFSNFYPSSFKIYKENILEENCFFEIPNELIGRLLVPVYIENNTGETKIVDISCRGEGFPVIPIYEDVEGPAIREKRLVSGNNGPFLISTDMLYGRDEYDLEFIIKPQEKSVGEERQEIKLINQPWKHFSRIVDKNWVTEGDKFKVEVQVINSGISSNFHVTWEIYKIDTNLEKYPWDWMDGKALINVKQIEENSTKTICIGNEADEENEENKYFIITEPGLYYIKTYVYKDFPPKLIFKEEKREITMENLRKNYRKKKDEKDIEIWQASDLHQAILVYVLPKKDK